MIRPHRTAWNMVVVSSAAGLQIINQFLFFRINASLYGATAETDPLWFALAVPTFLVAVVTGSLSYVLVPELVSSFEQDDDHQSAWSLASFVGLLTLAVSLLITGLLYAGAERICQALFEEKVVGQRELAVQLLQILSMQVVLTGGISFFQSVLHSRHQFALAAVGGVAGTGAALILVYLYGSRDISVIAWAINLGSVISLAIHAIPVVGRLGLPRAEGSKLFQLLTAFWPLLLGAIFLKVSPLLDRVWASELDPGSLSRINYADRIVAALLTVGTSSLSLIAFPQLAEHLASGGKTGFARHFALCFRRMALIIVPIVIGISVYSISIVGDLLQVGMFTTEDSRIVGGLVAILMGMFLGASTGELLARGFYVLGETRTPTIIGMVCLAAGLVLKYVLFQYFGIWGIALGIAMHFLGAATALAVFLSQRVGIGIFEGLPQYLLQSALAVAIACGSCALIYATSWGSTWFAGPVGALVYFASLLLMGNAEARQLIGAVQKKLGVYLLGQ